MAWVINYKRDGSPYPQGYFFEGIRTPPRQDGDPFMPADERWSVDGEDAVQFVRRRDAEAVLAGLYGSAIYQPNVTELKAL